MCISHIKDVIEALENLSRNSLRYATDNDVLILKLLDMNYPDLLAYCRNDYDLYTRIRIQRARIFIFDVNSRDIDKALSEINNLLQLTVNDQKLNQHTFNILYLKCLLYYFSKDQKTSRQIAEDIKNKYSSTQNKLYLARISKLMAITSSDLNEMISYSLKALEYFENTDPTEAGYIYKNLAYAYLELQDFNNSVRFLTQFLKILSIMDTYESKEVIVITGYLELLEAENILGEEDYEFIRGKLLDIMGFIQDGKITQRSNIFQVLEHIKIWASDISK